MTENVPNAAAQLISGRLHKLLPNHKSAKAAQLFNEIVGGQKMIKIGEKKYFIAP